MVSHLPQNAVLKLLVRITDNFKWLASCGQGGMTRQPKCRSQQQNSRIRSNKKGKDDFGGVIINTWWHYDCNKREWQDFDSISPSDSLMPVTAFIAGNIRIHEALQLFDWFSHEEDLQQLLDCQR